MDAGRQEEGDECGRVLVDLHRRNRAVIDVSEKKVVDWTVPVASVLIPRDTIPPRIIETSVCKISEFREYVEDSLPDEIP